MRSTDAGNDGGRALAQRRRESTRRYRAAVELLREGQTWLQGQREALEAALNGAPLEVSLGTLVRTATAALGDGTRAGFYLANDEGTSLHHVVGMPPEYAEAVDGVQIGPDSRACGLAAAIGEPVLTADVMSDPRWEPWRSLAERVDFRGCWSFPILSSAGSFIGTLALYWRAPREATERELELASLLTGTASIIISRHRESEARRRAEEALLASAAKDRLLQDVSTRLIRSADGQQLYDVILDAAVAIMGADFASLQMLHPDGERGPLLWLLGHRGFPSEAAAAWEWVRPSSGTTCGAALTAGERVIAADVSTCDFIVGTDDQATFLAAGIHAVQSTPLVSRAGTILGMISTHWRQPHAPSEPDLQRLDVLARQAADLIEQAGSENALRASEARYRTLFTSIDAGYCVVRVYFDERGKPHDCVFEDVNPAFERQLGIADARGKSMREIAPCRAEHWLETCARIALTGQAERTENVTERQDRCFDVHVFRIGEPHEHRVGILFADITERRHADRRKDEFLATLAHELRNPLAPIRTGLELLKRCPAEGAPPAETHAMMERQLTHMVRLIDDLLDVSRISRGTVELKLERVELQAVVQAAIDAARPFIASHHHEISLRLPAEPIWMEADPTRLDQVLGNLLTNAAKYTPDGGRVELAAKRAGADVVVTVTDTGVGLPADQLEAVFELFAQVNRTLNRSQGGLGIGLALVRRLVEMHGGTVTARSAGHGHGSTFTVRLPTAPAPDTAPRCDDTARTTPTAMRLKVLVVDDNADAADSLGDALELAGHEVRTAHEGAAALEVAETFLPDVVFCDLGMPGIDGYEVARRLRRGPASDAATLVALTGWGSEADRERSATAGFDVHLTKPVTLDVVQQVLAGVRSSDGRPSESAIPTT